MTMKIYYIENYTIPGTAAHSIQVENNIKELSKISDVTLISYFDEDKIDYCEHIGLKIPPIYNKMIPLRVFNLIHHCLKNIRFEKNSYLITRSPIIAFFLYNKFKKIAIEIHAIPSIRDHPLELPFFLLTFYPYFYYLRNKPKIEWIVINHGLKEELINRGFNRDRVHVLHDGVDLNKFNIDLSRERAREILDLPRDKIIVSYTGSLQNWKGYETFLRSYKYLKNRDVIYLLVGGSKEQIKKLRERYSNIVFVPFVDHGKIPLYLKSSDILVIPNSSKYTISVKYTSPLKLFEYMASKRPIVASDLPSIREIVSEDEVLFFKPEDEKDLADKIDLLIEDKDLQIKLSNNAFKKVQNFTWEKRAKRILEILRG
ncbi:MAG TPA: glycosyltransferase [Candidatus Nanopusillus sp.]|nr:glycosyltransferase [Candidatus Nanopusillus sp.]